MSCLILLQFTFFCSLLQLKYFSFCDQLKMVSYFNIFYGKMSDFVLLPLFGFTAVKKTEKFRFWKSLKCLNIFWWKKDMTSDLNISHGKMNDFVSFPLFGCTLIKKTLRNFDSESLWKILIFFIYKKRSQFWICPVKRCLTGFKLPCLRRILTISWEIRILNFIEII